MSRSLRANSKFKKTETRPDYEAEIEEWVRALSMYSGNRDALDLLLQKIEGVKELSVCFSGNSWAFKNWRSYYPD